MHHRGTRPSSSYHISHTGGPRELSITEAPVPVTSPNHWRSPRAKHHRGTRPSFSINSIQDPVTQSLPCAHGPDEAHQVACSTIIFQNYNN